MYILICSKSRTAQVHKVIRSVIASTDSCISKAIEICIIVNELLFVDQSNIAIDYVINNKPTLKIIGVEPHLKA